MSVLYENETAVFISHENFIKDIYKDVKKNEKTLRYGSNGALFNIKYPYIDKDKKRKLGRKRKIDDSVAEFLKLTDFIQSTYDAFRTELTENKIILNSANDSDEIKKNKHALEFSDFVYKETSGLDLDGITGGNDQNVAMNVEIKGHEFLFPRNCRFYCSNVNVIQEKLGFDVTYDIIVIDPPWWNKYIRRKRKKSNDGYSMMYNSELLNIPVQSLIHDNSLVVVWCTNAKSNLSSLRDEIFKKWGVHYRATWFWLKITTYGEPVCDFSDPPGKQPFEQILMATRNLDRFSQMEDRRIIVSVPSSLHSNKPPLTDILSKFLPTNPKCLEIFARYLLPNTTSYGLEAIRFQHISLYKEIARSNDNSNS